MTSRLENCPAPAKLNLFLHVIGRRADGYHLLQTAFQLLEHGDTLHFQARADGAIHRATPVPGVPEASDLCVRAARLLQAEVSRRRGQTPGADIHLDKRLPLGGGLGGGSSDAATTLIALNHLWQARLTRAELMALGLQLGADVPFFLFGQNAFGEGIGEALTPLSIPEQWYVVVEPGIEVATADIFSAQELTRDTKPVKILDFSDSPVGFGKNDLQEVASRMHAPIRQALSWLSGYGAARMTGSGACVFCPFSDPQQADVALAALPAGWKAWKSRGIARHPLDHLLES